MTISRRLKDYLDDQKVRYETLTHKEVFATPEIAQALHVPGKEMAKVVMVKVGERFVMVVIPANAKVDLTPQRELQSNPGQIGDRG